MIFTVFKIINEKFASQNNTCFDLPFFACLLDQFLDLVQQVDAQFQALGQFQALPAEKLLIFSNPLKKKDVDLCVWWASSLVGATTMARTPAPLGAFSWCTMGRRKAAVLPEPVGAQAITCRPLIMAGSACIWMGVGAS